MMALRIRRDREGSRGAIRFLLEHPATSSRKVGTIGFCMGGALSLYAACKNPEVGACVVFYGGHPNVKPDLEKLRAPVLGIYATATAGYATGLHELERRLKTQANRR